MFLTRSISRSVLCDSPGWEFPLKIGDNRDLTDDPTAEEQIIFNSIEKTVRSDNSLFTW